MTRLSEAFTKLNMLESSEFNLLDSEEKEMMNEFMNEETFDVEEVDIIDADTYEDDELQDSYVGKIVIECPICKSLVYKSREEFNEIKDEQIDCPYCYSVDNFNIIGKIEPMEDVVASEEVEIEGQEPIEEACDTVDESCDEKKEEKLEENLENVTVETEDEVITISSEDKNAVEPLDFSDEMIEEEHDTTEVIAPLDEPVEESYEEVDEFDEESFDEMVESWLTESYKNITSYKTSSVTNKGNKMFVEGVVTLTSGDQRKTNFRVTCGKLNENLNSKVLVENKELHIKKWFKGTLK